MNQAAEQQLWLARDRIADRIRAASNARLADGATPVASGHRFRRSIGHRIIRIGERVAAGSHLQPARSR